MGVVEVFVFGIVVGNASALGVLLYAIRRMERSHLRIKRETYEADMRELAKIKRLANSPFVVRPTNSPNGNTPRPLEGQFQG